MYYTGAELYSHYKRRKIAANREVASLAGLRISGDYRTVVPTLTKKMCNLAVTNLKQGILDRAWDVNGVGISKFTRPWDVIPALATFAPPAGDAGVGVEIELGFTSLNVAQQVAQHVQDWEYITLDYEGGNVPIEATFPPVLYSQYSDNADPIRYVQYLSENSGWVVRHQADNHVGTHVNVSIGDTDFTNWAIHERVDEATAILRNFTYQLQVKYFGRRPHGYGFIQHTDAVSWVEWKLFNSTINPRILRRYIDTAVSLTRMIADTSIALTEENVHIALEQGWEMVGNDIAVPTATLLAA